jgi:hypothetical protein
VPDFASAQMAILGSARAYHDLEPVLDDKAIERAPRWKRLPIDTTKSE